jgi:transcriptional antiterminator RfaH
VRAEENGQTIVALEYEAYLPMIRNNAVERGIAVLRDRPLFPRYLFVRIVNEQWRSLTGTFGVASIIMDGNRPASLPDIAIDQLRARERDGYVVLPRPEEITLTPGQAVRVTTGVFEGMVGVYQGMGPAERERVLLNILGRKTTVLVVGGTITGENDP